jgi:hypothetical protein
MIFIDIHLAQCINPGSGKNSHTTFQKSTHTTNKSETKDQGALGIFYFAEWTLGIVNSHNGIPLFSCKGERWIQSRTGEKAPLERISTLSTAWHNQTQDTRLLTYKLKDVQLPIQMPNRTVPERYLAVYEKSFACHIFPSVDPIRFRTTIETAYAKPGTLTDQERLSAQACIYSFLAFSSFLNSESAANDSFSSEEYAWKAYYLLGLCCFDVSIETLQAGSMMVSAIILVPL